MKKLFLLITVFLTAGTLSASICDLSGYLTYTQGGWGSPSNSTPGQTLDTYFSQAFPAGLVISGPGASLTFTTPDAIRGFLPQGGKAKKISRNYVDPTSKLSVLAGQVVAMTLNVTFDANGYTRTNPTPVRDLIIEDGDFEGWTVADFLALAQSALCGGNTGGYSYSDINDAATKFNENFDNGTVNKGFLTCSDNPSIGDLVWIDQNGNGIQNNGEPGMQGVTVRLYDCDNELKATTTTDANGNYTFSNLQKGSYYVKFTAPSGYVFTTKDAGDNDLDSDADPETGRTTCTYLSKGENDMSWDAGLVGEKSSIGNFVWEDTNENGIQDESEPGKSGITVQLYDCNGELLSTSSTDNSGKYIFENLESGSYKVKFTLPENYVFTGQNEGEDDNKDSDAHTSTGYTPCTWLAMGENDMSWDAGIMFLAPALKASVGDKVWNDANKNGQQDGGETGVQGVVVDLYNCQGGFVATTTTNASGIYGFSELTAGNYKVRFHLPEGYVFTLRNEGNDATDSDANPANGYTLCEQLESGENDLTWDAGIYMLPVGDVDIKIEKTTATQNVQDGATVLFTVTATNIGTAEASNVRVGDLLPESLVFVSSSSANYNNVTGIWNIGTLAPDQAATLDITTTVDVDFANASLVDFGIAAPYNVFIFRNISQPSSDTEGKMAVGGDAYLSEYSVGDKIVHGNEYEDVLIVDGDLEFVTGRVFGNAVYGNSVIVNPLYIDGDIIKGNPIDFEAAEIHLKSVSAQLAALPADGSVSVFEGQLNLTGDDPIINVFDVTETEFNTTHTKVISAPNGSVVIINIPGNNLVLTGGLSVIGASRQQVIYNFFEATEFEVFGIAVEGSILAPKAHVKFHTGQQNGQMIAKSLEGQAQFNFSPFVGNVPVDQAVVNTAALLNVDQEDINGDNNSASVNLTVSSNDPGNGNGNGSGQNNNWQLVSSFEPTEIVWAMAVDIDGNNYIGTAGGKIYKIDLNNQRTHINDGMGVAWVWDLHVEDDGAIFAATELGVFKSNTLQSEWTQVLSGMDVRALAKSDNSVYMGVWGGGVYRLQYGSPNAVPINNGLNNLAVHALTADSHGNLYAGTMGGGVYKYEPDNWTQLSVGYDYIWAMDITSDDKLIAATYGGGVFASFDLGASWQNLNTGLNAPFVYSVLVDPDNSIYVSSWAGGVYMLSFVNKSFSWQPYGMGGFGVSSVLYNDTDGMMYAGTRDGLLYRQDIVLGLKREQTDIPSSFDLSQNYPNPFNPATRIQFSIPSAGNYSLKIYNILGQEVRTLVDGEFQAGTYTYTFNAAGLSSGIYIYRFSGQGINIAKKMMLVK